MVWQAWMRNAISRKLQEQLRDALNQTATEEPSLPSPGPCHVGVLFALGSEAGFFEDRLTGAVAIRGETFRATEGALGGHRVVVVRTGIGRRAAAEATQHLIAGHHPQWIISAGFCGGAHDRVRRHDIVIADSVRHAQGTNLTLATPQIAGPLLEGVHVGRILTVDQIISSPSEKRDLGERHGAIALEMETLAIAQVCQEHQTPLWSIRVVSDAVDDPLPKEIKRLAQPLSTARLAGTVAGVLFNRPSAAKDLWAMHETSLVAARRLADFLEPLIAQLPRTAIPLNGAEP
jgi:adenosylhomocysteine nucleosidase